MKTAKEMFEEMGWELELESNNDLLYSFKKIEEYNLYIYFEKDKQWSMIPSMQRWSTFKTNENPLVEEQGKFVIPQLTMNKNAHATHLTVRHLLAIHQQMKELGWLK